MCCMRSKLPEKILGTLERNTVFEKTSAIGTICFYIFGGYWLWSVSIPALDRLFDIYLLNILREGWHGFLDYMNEIMPPNMVMIVVCVIVRLIMFWLMSLPSIIFEHYNLLVNRRIQSKVTATERKIACLWDVIWRQATVEFLTALITLGCANMLHFDTTYDKNPAWYRLVGAMMLAMVMEDTWHYTFHRYCHSSPAIYINVHKRHHEFAVPFSFQATYCTISEMILLSIGFIIPTVMLEPHMTFVMLWSWVRQAEALETHSGYDTKWLIYSIPFHFLPGYAGARFHDFHHSRNQGNFASFFNSWDTIFDSNIPFKNYERARLLRAEKEE